MSGWEGGWRLQRLLSPMLEGPKCGAGCGLYSVSRQIAPQILRRRQREPFLGTGAHGRGRTAHQVCNQVARQGDHLTFWASVSSTLTWGGQKPHLTGCGEIYVNQWVRSCFAMLSPVLTQLLMRTTAGARDGGVAPGDLWGPCWP